MDRVTGSSMQPPSHDHGCKQNTALVGWLPGGGHTIAVSRETPVLNGSNSRLVVISNLRRSTGYPSTKLFRHCLSQPLRQILGISTSWAIDLSRSTNSRKITVLQHCPQAIIFLAYGTDSSGISSRKLIRQRAQSRFQMATQPGDNFSTLPPTPA